MPTSIINIRGCVTSCLLMITLAICFQWYPPQHSYAFSFENRKPFSAPITFPAYNSFFETVETYLHSFFLDYLHYDKYHHVKHKLQFINLLRSEMNYLISFRIPSPFSIATDPIDTSFQPGNENSVQNFIPTVFLHFTPTLYRTAVIHPSFDISHFPQPADSVGDLHTWVRSGSHTYTGRHCCWACTCNNIVILLSKQNYFRKRVRE